MTRGPTSSVRISSASPLLSRRLFFQPLYSTFSTVTCPFSAAGDDAAGVGAGRGSPDPALSPDRRSPAPHGRPAVEPCAGSGDPRRAAAHKPMPTTKVAPILGIG